MGHHFANYFSIPFSNFRPNPRFDPLDNHFPISGNAPFDVAPRAREPDHSPTRAAGVCGADACGARAPPPANLASTQRWRPRPLSPLVPASLFDVATGVLARPEFRTRRADSPASLRAWLHSTRKNSIASWEGHEFTHANKVLICHSDAASDAEESASPTFSAASFSRAESATLTLCHPERSVIFR
ncbi:MAG: hypothetical protein DMG88_04360 [Acidobacteria bacterium]|nr:MAG: hypothetical protein DMG88_04360 [Acidobacteriota bacterium]